MGQSSGRAGVAWVKGNKNYDTRNRSNLFRVLGFLYDRLRVLDPDRALCADSALGNAVKKPGIPITIIGLSDTRETK